MTAGGGIMAVEVAAMRLAQIPAILPPAITVSREVAELCLTEDLAVHGTSGPAALAWQWALTGKGPTPVSLREWHAGPPDHETLLDESRWPYGDAWSGRAERAEIDKARFLLWWLTADPQDDLPARFHHVPAAKQVVEHGSDAVTLAEVYNQSTRPRRP
jgi:hypothetical protein